MTDFLFFLFLSGLPIAAYFIGYQCGKESEYMRREQYELARRQRGLK